MSRLCVEIRKHGERYHGSSQGVEWCSYSQLKRYAAIDKEIPVYVILGVGKECNSPEEVFLIQIKGIKYTKLFQSFLKNYKIPTNYPVDHRLLK